MDNHPHPPSSPQGYAAAALPLSMIFLKKNHGEGLLGSTEKNEGVTGVRMVRAHTFWQRLRGLMFYNEFPKDYDALLIEPCNSIHCFFMRFAIDAVFLDKDSKILKIATCKPWSIGPVVWKAAKVLELPEDTAHQIGLKEGAIFSADHLIQARAS